MARILTVVPAANKQTCKRPQTSIPCPVPARPPEIKIKEIKIKIKIIHTRSTSSRDLLHVPRCSTSIRQKSIRFIGVNIYNFFFKIISLVSELSTYKLPVIVKSFLLSLDLPDVKNIHKNSIIRL